MSQIAGLRSPFFLEQTQCLRHGLKQQQHATTLGEFPSHFNRNRDKQPERGCVSNWKKWTASDPSELLLGQKHSCKTTHPCFPITLPETNIAPESGWLEYYFPIGFRPIFRCKLAVSFREGSWWLSHPPCWNHPGQKIFGPKLDHLTEGRGEQRKIKPQPTIAEVCGPPWVLQDYSYFHHLPSTMAEGSKMINNMSSSSLVKVCRLNSNRNKTL